MKNKPEYRYDRNSGCVYSKDWKCWDLELIHPDLRNMITHLFAQIENMNTRLEDTQRQRDKINKDRMRLAETLESMRQWEDNGGA